MSENIDQLLCKNIPKSFHKKFTHRLGLQWLDWTSSCQKINRNPDENIDLSLLGKVWVCSEFCAVTMLRHPFLWFELLDNDLLNKNISFSEYQLLLSNKIDSCLNDADLMKQLRLFRHQQMLRIAWRDLSNLASTSETLKNLTYLAEACVDSTLELLYQDQCKQLGVPLNSQGEAQRLIVIGMGKLGGHELNFSSDIDLIFCFDEEGDVQGERTLANSQFFIRLGQRFIKVLNDVTAEGFVFRVDMRLRPYGDSGPLVMSFAALEQYYQTQGRDWERYAMIKARIIGGDRKQGRVLMDMLKPFIYRRYLDFGAFESIREMKDMIDSEIRRKGNLHNIKLGSGGIREIEFIGQTFQLLRGGSDPQLQTRSIIQVLNLLAEKEYLTNKEVSVLNNAYDFLRRLENRLQMFADAQTHLLPDDENQQASMALAMGYDNWSELLFDCDSQRQAVQLAFSQLLNKDESKENDNVLKNLWLYQPDEEDAIQILNDANISNSTELYKQIQQFNQSPQLNVITKNSRQRLDKLMPLLLANLAGFDDSLELFKRIINLLQSILTRSVYLSLLNEYPLALKQLVKLFAASPWIAKLLSRYPILLDELLDPRALYEIPTKKKLRENLDVLLQRVADDEEQQIETLRKFKQAQILKIAAMDVAGVMDVFEVSEQLSNIAEVLMDEVMTLAWHWMIKKYGIPSCIIDGETYLPSMAIVAYGKMGGKELSYSSDLDIVFLHDSQGKQQQTDGDRSLDNASFFARMAQRVIQLISLQTANGRLYEIDMRLRPDGNAGMLVSNLQAYDRYQHEKAWTWEHQALIRARILCSSEHLKSEFDRIRRSVLMRERDTAGLAVDVVEMREKMRDALGSKSLDKQFHLKQDAGGLVDIEFLAQYGVLNCAHKNEQLTDNTATRKLLLQLVTCSGLSATQAQTLHDIYKIYRTCSHHRALQEVSSLLSVDTLRDEQNKVKQIWQSVFN